jgi:hypothetical protein
MFFFKHFGELASCTTETRATLGRKTQNEEKKTSKQTKQNKKQQKTIQKGKEITDETLLSPVAC